MLCRVDQKGHIHPASSYGQACSTRSSPQPRHSCVACTLSSTQVSCSHHVIDAPEQPQSDLWCSLKRSLQC